MPVSHLNVPQFFTAFEETRAKYLEELERCSNANPPRAIPREITEQLYSRAYLVMTAYCRADNWPDGLDGNPRHAFPALLATIIRMQIRAIIGGDISGPIRDLLRRGTPATGPIEHLDQGWAVAYVGAAKAEIIKDKSPTKTVTEAFDVTPRALQRWNKEQAETGLTWRDLVPRDIPEEDIPDYLARRMQEAARRYLKKGRLATSRRKPDPGIPG